MKRNTVLLVAAKLVFVFLMLPAGLSAQHVMRVLAIGNSFSEDAVESYLSPLAQADGVELIIGNMFIPGCSLETHWNNAQHSLPAYSYRKIVDGKLIKTENQALVAAIKDENWDIITFQQVSSKSGLVNSFFPYITNLLRYVQAEATNPEVKYALHQTWAYASNSTHPGFINYDNSQERMYSAIVETVSKVAEQTQIDIIIPAGTAIQNGRTSFVGDNFCSDGYHLNAQIGRYTAACAWYEKFLGRHVIGNPFVPVGMSPIEASIAQYAAYYAVKQAKVITSMRHFSSID
ncbi:protein of unknown function [Saccharicrinis carchari]|uniref:DUF4886 domain-containing protein n=1 Tax=Saccharicrinis carchari TaxID=1168039 RepID=A0A521E242_SACCC|nr:DUF4886 domain-containing protein [Saccharicrinis carchari]SMO78037.1 protein of unknown function [Saccharicrinis carchari]